MKLPLDTDVRDDVREAIVPHAGGFKRLGGPQLVARVVQAGVRCRKVPAARCHEATDLRGKARMVVECRCGHRPVLDLAAFPTKCECDRWFYYAGTEVFALASPSD